MRSTTPRALVAEHGRSRCRRGARRRVPVAVADATRFDADEHLGGSGRRTAGPSRRRSPYQGPRVQPQASRWQCSVRHLRYVSPAGYPSTRTKRSVTIDSAQVESGLQGPPTQSCGSGVSSLDRSRCRTGLERRTLPRAIRGRGSCYSVATAAAGERSPRTDLARQLVAAGQKLTAECFPVGQLQPGFWDTDRHRGLDAAIVATNGPGETGQILRCLLARFGPTTTASLRELSLQLLDCGTDGPGR